jgi:surfactin synthase thioesterase subunit/ferredoxin
MASTGIGSSAWIRRFHPSGDSTARLACFPHAGGSATYYHPVSARFAGDIDVVAWQYPGRQDRRHEPCITNIDTLADRITEQFLALSPQPTVFFGHSMGATLAFEVAWRLEHEGFSAPLRVIASGRRAPMIDRRENVHRRNDAAVLAEMRLLNGTEAAVLDDEEIVRMALPAIRGDYEAIETYTYVPGRMINCPITVLAGDADPRTPIEDASRWRSVTNGAFRMRVFPGGHFYLTRNVAAVNDEIAAELEQLRKADRAMGTDRWKVTLDQRTCVSSGQCAATASRWFEITVDGTRTVQDEVDPNDDVIDAAECCPVGAISVVNTADGTLLAP